MRLSIIIGSFLVILAVFAVITLWGHTSFWFIWHLTPSSDIKIAINQTQPGASTITNYLQSQFLSDLSPLTSHTRRFVYTKQADTESLIIIAKNPLLFSEQNYLTTQLNQNGWHTTRLGLIITASRGERSGTPLTTQSVSSAISLAIKSIFSPSLPIQPILAAVLDTNAYSLLDSNISILGRTTSQINQAAFYIATDQNKLPTISNTSLPALPQKQELVIAIPSQTLTSILSTQLPQWDTILHDKFNFELTKPAILEELTKYQNLAIIIKENQAAIAVKGNATTFTNNAATWIQAEEAHSRPIKKAFKLPDGTLGYEIRPGDPQPIFSTTADQTGCRTSLNEQINMQLCQHQNIGSLATNNTSSPSFLTNLMNNNGWHVTIGSDYISKLNIPNLQSLAITGTDSTATITVQFTE